MKTNNNIQEEIDKTLDSLNNWDKIVADPFFYTRLKVKIENKNLSKKYEWFFDSPLLRPALIAAAVLINVLILNFYLTQTYSVQESPSDFASALTDEYSLNQSSESYIVYNNE